jgi:molybdate transport system ATP-binding protein
MTLQQNLLFGAGWSSKPQDRLQIANDIMAHFDIAHLVLQMPHQLSGGEQQRAAVARALISATTFDGPGQPHLLLDEPFSGLGAIMRDSLLSELKAWVTHWKIPVLSVTHDIAEAFQLQAEVIKIAEGKVIQQGTAGAVLAEERKRLLAQLGSPA